MASSHQVTEQPPRVMSTKTNSEFLSTTATTESESSVSSTHSSDTNFGIISLRSDNGNDAFGSEMTKEETEWLKAAHEFTRSEKPFKEQKTFRVARRLRTWNPKRSVTWSFLRRLYNGREDLKNDVLSDLSDLNIETVE